MRFFRTFSLILFSYLDWLCCGPRFHLKEKKLLISIYNLLVQRPLASHLFYRFQIEKDILYEATAIDKSIRNLISTGSVEDVRVFLDPEKSDENGVNLYSRFGPKLELEKFFLREIKNYPIGN